MKMRKPFLNDYWRQFQIGIISCSMLCCIYFLVYARQKFNSTKNSLILEKHHNSQVSQALMHSYEKETQLPESE
jgi:hypothetical protein